MTHSEPADTAEGGNPFASNERPQFFVLLAIGAAILAYFNSLIAPLGSILNDMPIWLGYVSVTLTLAVLCAEAGLVAAWGVFGASSFWLRLGRSTALGFLFLTAGAAGFLFVVDRRSDFADFLILVVTLYGCYPLVMVAAQVPLWVARIVLHWTFAARPEEYAAAGRAGTMSIQAMFLATGLVAGGLGLARLVPAAYEWIRPGSMFEPSSFFAGLLTVCTCAGFGSAVLVLPAIAACFHPRDATGAAVGLLVWYLVIALSLWLVQFALSFFATTFGRFLLPQFGVAVYCGLIATALVLTRARGYRLLTKRL